MARDSLQYDRMVENALRGVVRQALASVVEQGLPGNHHFYLTFRTNHPGVEIADRLRAQYPQEMTIVLQHQFWGLEVGDEHFVVNLSFSNAPERLKVPYAALVSFVDPSVKFGLQFQAPPEAAGAAIPAAEKAATPARASKDTPPLALATAAGQPDKPSAEKPAAERKSGDAPAKELPGKEAAAGAAGAEAEAEAEADKKDPDKVVSLDAFRKK
jgi:hypothetical protein